MEGNRARWERDESERAGAEPKSQATDSRHVYRGCQWIGLVGDFGIRGTGYKGRRWGPHRCFRFYPTRPHLVPLGGSPRKHPSPSLGFIHEDIIIFFIIHGSTDPVIVFVKVGRRSGNPDRCCDHSHLNYCERVEKWYGRFRSLFLKYPLQFPLSTAEKSDGL